MVWVNALLFLGALALLAPCLVFAAECLVAALGSSSERRAATAETPRPRFAVLVPAHDEASGIAATLEGIKPQLGPGDRIVVVADNCTDDTADLARATGVEVIERTSAAERGKGYALVFGLDHLAADPPDVVIVFDADCRIEKGTLEDLAKEAFASNQPAQAEYLIHPPEDGSPGAMVSAFAFLVRNRTRPRGLARLGLPVGLTGTGMAFPWLVMRNAPATGAYLVEDLLMGIEMALAGQPPRLAPHVQVTSVLPEDDGAAIGQRRRWEHGQLITLTRQAPRLLYRGLVDGRVALVAIGLDLMVPPLALLVLVLVAAMSVLGLAALLGASSGPFWVVTIGFILVGLGVAAAWSKHGREAIPLRVLLTAPLYVLWKVPIYAAFLVKKTQKTWERTDRN